MKWIVTACWLSQKSWHDRMRLSYHSVLQWFTADTISTETGTTGTVEFHLFQAWTWQLTMLQIYVTLWGRWCVCVWVYLELLSHFLPFKIHLTNISPMLIKMVDFKNLAWATSFATQASRKFIYLPTGQVGKKVIVIPWNFSIFTERDKNIKSMMIKTYINSSLIWNPRLMYIL